MPEGKGRKALGSIVLVAAAVVTAAAVVIAFLYVAAPRATRVRVGDVAPDFTLPPVFTVPPAGGSPPLRLSSTRGGPTFLFFFDTLPCFNFYFLFGRNNNIKNLSFHIE